MMTRRSILGAIISISLVIIGVWYATDTYLQTKSDPIKIAVNKWPGYYLLFVAQDEGFFEKNGVDVKVILDTNYGDSQQRYIDGQVDGTCQVIADSVTQYDAGLAPMIVYIFDYSVHGDIIISSLDSVEKLKGKTVGVDGINSFSHLFMIKTLERHGMSENDVFFKSVPAHLIIREIEVGTIAAGHVWEPTRSEALSKGYYSLASAAEFQYIVTDVLVFNEKTINDRPKEIHAIVKSLVEAQEFLKSNPDNALAIMAKNSQTKPETIFSGLDAIHMLDISENQKALANDEKNNLHQNIKNISQFYLDRGLISSIPTHDQIIDSQFINQSYKN
jgi:NitT/TauT family transport system substrate-binding protein